LAIGNFATFPSALGAQNPGALSHAPPQLRFEIALGAENPDAIPAPPGF
jgi:hypothetical protein